MLAIVGTIPDPDFPLVQGEAVLEGDTLAVQGRAVEVNRGTPALAAAALKAREVLGGPAPVVFLVGDVGLGQGSRRLYDHLVEHIGDTAFSCIVFHYLQPDVDGHNRVIFALEAMEKRPLLIADAGLMYAAKMSGFASSFDLFTPDAGELAFLADEEAPHPFYTRGFILHQEDQAPEHIARAYDHDNAAGLLLVKGAVDRVADRKGVRATVDAPSEEAMEAIGGTGDTLTGLVAALAASGMDMAQAAVTAARANRLAGAMARPTPATQILDIIRCIPAALGQVLR